MPEEEGESLIHVAIKAEELFQLGPLHVTNSMVGALLASVVLLAGAWWFARRNQLVPTRVQSLLELPIELMAGIISASTSRWRSYAALILGFFLIILVANWIGLLPGVGTIGIAHVDETGHEAVIPLVRPASADLNFTLGLAIVSFVMFVFWGIRANGAGGYLKELLGQPLYMAPLMFPINLISEFSRLISLSMRLFGNVFAGEVLLATMIALVPILVPAAFLGLELIFGFVQALVFALLAMTYISTAIAEHHSAGHDSDHDTDHGAAHAAGADHPPAAEAASA
ncbi:MAG TPA: F0F1 ATP synthase subunit A [Candidatus Limnocylindria bacterium]|nr:F0F1 ATP synthase subunit A [Candidatus Limnocylindria bacterium]